ncbi:MULTISPECIES: AtpZ/AtpI family protein [unclassified Helicobacter]|uniref:AtpZ/AtpI family protein n=1 Tax=unclassified Helicobacter TaxID=2593540 RepID=UPI000CF17663|nr:MULTISPECIES: AtpZ/AtpI family protein [unclassified Helicobacter]
MKKDEKKIKKVVTGIYDLSLGISIVVAVLIGIGIGVLLKNLTGIYWLLWLGVFWGVSAGFLNIYKAYKRSQRDLKELSEDIKYTYHQDKKQEKKDV